jgi:hypothetical protein
MPILCHPNVNKLSAVELRLEDYYLIRMGLTDRRPVD